ncbi:heme/hemin ABC transporter substrate-binding protein [Gordonia hydrophobica]|uniref:ABC transporter substrate-binding protein n=1 Tax=Gordonia hydrophobica TaxID=40516 RepID=A0ABZ2U3U5_9ACTN|nr:ABC transporter substrate-binding protein [Gordonia hydrophobica]MBM7367601.1 iron complex transport system substrate-binding protein [Gordonia hydrophobica]
MAHPRSAASSTRPRLVSRRFVAVWAALASVVVLVTGCTTEPIDTGAGTAAATKPTLRSGPTTATLPHPDIVPVVTDPTPGPRADRIIALDRNGTLGSIVFALGLGPHVVGRDRSTTFPSAGDLPYVTETGHAINPERVLAQNPSIVLVTDDATPPGSVEQLRAAGIAVEVFTGKRSIAGNSALITDVARALGVPDAGAALVARTEKQIADARALVPDPSEDPTIGFLYIRGPHLILLAGPRSGADDLIAALGGIDAGTKAGLTSAFTQVSAESMIRADPEVILVMTQGAESVGGMDAVLRLPAVADTDAGRHGRIVEMDETQILMFGPDTGLVLGALAKAIYA